MFKASVFSSFRFQVKDFKIVLVHWPLCLRHGWHNSTHTTLKSGCVNFWQLFPSHLSWFSLLLVCSAADRNWLNPMTQAPRRLLILQMSQDRARDNLSSSPQMAIHVQVWDSLSRPAINQKTMLHTVASINTQCPLLANKSFVSVKNLHSLIFF